MKIGLKRHFRKQFDKLPHKTQKIFYDKLRIFVIDPFDPILNNHKLHGELKNTRSINISGDIRAIYEELDENRVLFLMIGSHNNLYK